ncbi:MAG: hypothetical protein U9N62_07440 [Thermotogota bacterium]|nr:hypothetical protein [Thermotogota bacterium]
MENTSFTLDWPAYEDKQDPSKQIQHTINVYDKGSFTDSRSDWDFLLLRTAPATPSTT